MPGWGYDWGTDWGSFVLTAIDISRLTVDYLPYVVMPPVNYVPTLSLEGSP
jgi:hypothetical protein